ncbi:MAG: hypothetical protein ACLFR1_13355 [Spirochaetia bacterium]
MIRSLRKSWILLICVCFSLLLSCIQQDDHDYFIVGSQEQQQELRQLYTYLDNPENSSENRFVIIQQISHILLNLDEIDIMNLFLTTEVEKQPDDPYNAYYLYLVSQNYKNEGAYPFAVHYMERILKNHPDLIIRDNSIHHAVLNELLTFVDDPEYRVIYYKELIARFSNEIDLGVHFYFLAEAYEDTGEWDLALQAYQQYLRYPDTDVPGHPEAAEYVRNLIEFNNSSKSWTRDSLQELINSMRYAINTRNARALEQLRAGVNFFTVFWEQDATDMNERVIFDLATVLRQSNVRFASELDIDSNAQEAYLQTRGWAYRIRTWYLYFRKIHFPADPDINGRWEWAGIYFGDKL